MNASACRKLLKDAWVGITSHNTYFTVDDMAFDQMGDEEIVDWTGAIVSGRCTLSYHLKDDTMIPVLGD